MTLALPENPATGYCWRLTTSGAAGEHVFVLRVAAAGRHEVLAELARPWEAAVRDVRTFVVEAS